MVPLLFRNLLGVADGKDSGVIHQKVEPAEPAHCLIEQVIQLASAGNVGGNSNGTVANLAGNFFDTIFAPAAQNHARSFSGQGNSARDVPKAVIEVLHRATEDLRWSGLAERALKTGERAPAFTLNNQDGTRSLLLNSLRKARW